MSAPLRFLVAQTFLPALSEVEGSVIPTPPILTIVAPASRRCSESPQARGLCHQKGNERGRNLLIQILDVQVDGGEPTCGGLLHGELVVGDRFDVGAGAVALLREFLAAGDAADLPQ